MHNAFMYLGYEATSSVHDALTYYAERACMYPSDIIEVQAVSRTHAGNAERFTRAERQR